MEPEPVHPLIWMQDNLKIITFDGRMIPLRANVAQRRVHKTLSELQEANNLPIRAIICKARREGVSTYISGRFFLEINTKPNRTACVASADSEATYKVFKMARLFQEQMPEALQRPERYSGKNELVYTEPHRSEFVAQTAGKDVLGRGGLTHYFHATEFAFWQKAKEQFGGAVQEVPDIPDSMVIIESTAHGMGGAFCDMFWQAVNDWKRTKNPANYIPIFLPWYIFPDYQMVIPKGVEFVVGKSDGSILFEWVEAEPELVAKYNLCNEQLFWRRWAIKNKCQSDLSLFFQEFPATAREAFQTSGRNVFNQFIVDKWAGRCADGRTVLFENYRRGHKPELFDVPREENCWRIWKLPQPGHEYTMGIDTQEGKQSDPDDPKSDYDWHGVEVFDRHTNEFVAEYHGQGDNHELGEQCLSAAEFYNHAWVAPEVPKGMVALDVLKQAGYNHIYERQVRDEHREAEESEDLGWRTTATTRQKMIEDFKSAVNHEDIVSYSKGLVEEMRTFVVDKTGKCIHLPGEKDDRLFGAMIALQIHLRVPVKPQPYPYASTAQAETADYKHAHPITRAGAIDTWQVGDEEGEEGYLYTT